MSQFSNHINNKKIRTLLFLFVCMFFSSVSVFSQTDAKEGVVTNTTEMAADVKQGNTAGNSNMNFVLWFMGSKQDPNGTISAEGNNAKKKIMTSGIAPNRLLIKAFLKKAVNFESSLA
jgi:hypothetical protein